MPQPKPSPQPLAVQGGVAVRVEHDVLGVRHQPDGAESVVVTEIGQLDNADSSPTSHLHRAHEFVEREGFTKRECMERRRYVHFAVHCLGHPLMVSPDTTAFRSARRTSMCA